MILLFLCKCLFGCWELWLLCVRNTHLFSPFFCCSTSLTSQLILLLLLLLAFNHTKKRWREEKERKTLVLCASEVIFFYWFLLFHVARRLGAVHARAFVCVRLRDLCSWWFEMDLFLLQIVLSIICSQYNVFCSVSFGCDMFSSLGCAALGLWSEWETATTTATTTTTTRRSQRKKNSVYKYQQEQHLESFAKGSTKKEIKNIHFERDRTSQRNRDTMKKHSHKKQVI